MTKAGSHCCKLPLKTPEKGKETQEVGGSLAAAKDVSVAVLSELGDIFLGGKNVSAPHLTGFGNLKNVSHSDSP